MLSISNLFLNKSIFNQIIFLSLAISCSSFTYEINIIFRFSSKPITSAERKWNRKRQQWLHELFGKQQPISNIRGKYNNTLCSPSQKQKTEKFRLQPNTFVYSKSLLRYFFNQSTFVFRTKS